MTEAPASLRALPLGMLVSRALVLVCVLLAACAQPYALDVKLYSCLLVMKLHWP